MSETHAFGALRSEQDYRDAYVAAVATPPAYELPERYETDLSNLGPVMYQQKIPSCVAHSVALEMKRYWYFETGKLIDFSPRFLDILVKRFDGLNRATDGTYPRLMFKLASKYGCATTQDLPNDATLPVLQYRNDSLITKEILDKAATYKIPGYLRVKDDVHSVKNAIWTFGSVSQLMQIGKEWWTPSWSPSDILPLATPAVIESGHQINPFAFDGPVGKLRNHWSDQWADEGNATYSMSAWERYSIETWAIAEIPKDAKKLLASLPAPADFHYQWNANLKMGMYGADVKFAQIAFMILGLMDMVPADELGYFGAKTARANESFQRISGISPTAWDSIGPKTRDALNKRFAI